MRPMKVLPYAAILLPALLLADCMLGNVAGPLGYRYRECRIVRIYDPVGPGVDCPDWWGPPRVSAAEIRWRTPPTLAEGEHVYCEWSVFRSPVTKIATRVVPGSRTCKV